MIESDAYEGGRRRWRRVETKWMQLQEVLMYGVEI